MFWLSSAHVLGEAAERHYGCYFCVGLLTEEGFFYEMAIEERPVTNGDYPSLEKVSKLAIKQKQKLEHLVVPKETLHEMFTVCATHLPCSNVAHCMCAPVQQIQGAAHSVEDPRRHIHHRVPLRPDDRPLRWPSYSSHWQDRVVHGDKGPSRSFQEVEYRLTVVLELCFILLGRSEERLTSTYLRYLFP